jgi:Protein of unknown function (DUF1573)
MSFAGPSAGPLVVMVVLALPTASVRADLHFTRPQIHRGIVRSGLPLRHRFAFTNPGPGAVTILGLRASCGCLAPRLDRPGHTYQPGEHGEILIDVQTLSQPAGPNTWRVEVLYQAEGQERTTTLELRAELLREVQIEPATLTLYTSGALAHEVTVTDLRPRALRVVGASTSCTHLAARVLPNEGMPGVHRVRIEVTPSLPQGRHAEVLTIVTDDPVYRELRVPVTVVKRPRQGVRASPSSISIAMLKGQPAPSRIVLLRPNGDGEVEVDRVETDNPAVTCHWAKGPGKMATLKVGVDHARVQGSFRSTVRVHVRQPAPCVLTIPVVCTGR